MKRLTRKENIDYTTNVIIHTVGFGVVGDRNKDYNNALKKLYELENLEEQLGCPLEVRCKITIDTTIYDFEGNSFEISYIHKKGFTAIMNFGFGSNYEFDFAYSDYKKVWFFKKDKSE